MRNEALKSLYGGKGDQVREQTVLTPSWILDGVEAVFGGGIALDPCTTPENPVGAERFFTENDNGLEHNWVSGTYCNPPYAYLEDWLTKCRAEALRGCAVVALVPFRPQRTWFCDNVRGYEVLTLAQFPFVGHKDVFPAALCLVTYNCTIRQLVGPTGKSGKTKNFVTGVWRLA